MGRCFASWPCRRKAGSKRGISCPDHVHMMISIPPKYASFAGGWLYQGQERDPSGPGLWRAKTQFPGTALLGQRLLRLDRRSRRSGDTGVHQETGARGQSPGSIEHVALMATFRWPHKFGAASATPTAALSGPITKAPGSAGGYLPLPLLGGEKRKLGGEKRKPDTRRLSSRQEPAAFAFLPLKGEGLRWGSRAAIAPPGA